MIVSQIYRNLYQKPHELVKHYDYLRHKNSILKKENEYFFLLLNRNKATHLKPRFLTTEIKKNATLSNSVFENYKRF